MSERLVIRVPVAVMIRLRSTTEENDPNTVNKQLAKIINTFDWDSLPYELNFDPQAYAFQQVTLLVSAEGKAALKRYCDWNGKRMNLTMAQALVLLGLFEVPVKRAS
jgi:hypothetical protein